MSQTLTAHLNKAIPRQLLADVEDKLPYCDPALLSFRIDPGRLDEVVIEVEAAADADAVAQKVGRLVSAMVTGWREIPVKVRWDGRATRPTHPCDPWPALVARQDVVEVGQGQVALAGPTLALINYFNGFVEELARDLEAEEAQYPQMISVDTLDRCQYFSSFPHHVTFCSHLTPDVDLLQAFAKPRPAGEPPPLGKGLVTPTHALNPAMCFHTYATLADVALDGPKRVTTVGRCFRHEAGALNTLERLWDFTMAEIIFIGTAEQVKAGREQALARVAEWTMELGLHGWVETANDPFFMSNFVAKKYHQLLTDAKFELRLTLPASGRSLAAASFNYHESFFGRSYGISIEGGPAHTSCTAFGLERLAYAFMAQHGVDPSTWPAVVLEKIQQGGAHPPLDMPAP